MQVQVAFITDWQVKSSFLLTETAAEIKLLFLVNLSQNPSLCSILRLEVFV